MPTQKHRVGIIGVGRKGTQHARGYELRPWCEIIEEWYAEAMASQERR